MKTLVMVAALASAAALFAQDEKQIQDAIRGLGAESFEEREKATAELKKIGAPALDALKKAAEENGDPEVRVRAKRLVEEIAKPPPAPKRAPMRAPGWRGGSMLSISKSGDATVYSLQPPDGDAIEFHRSAKGGVKLVHPDGKGGKAEVESESIEKFVVDHKELAEKYGITQEGIEYGGTRMSFNGLQGVIPQWGVPMVPMPPMKGFDDLFAQSEELRKAFDELRRDEGRWTLDRWPGGFFGREVIRGAQVGPVPDVLRSQLSIPEGVGVVVESVREGSTAAAAGVKRHDVILEIDGRKVANPTDVRTLLKRDSKVKALRGGKEQTLQPAPAEKKEY